jgi:hypothetical protein
MSAPVHADLAAGRWQSFTLVEQLANVGSEVERALRARERGLTQRFDRAVDRALELFDLTAIDARWSGPRRREILRAREYFCRVCFGGDVEADADAYLSRYFLQFATAARARRR